MSDALDSETHFNAPISKSLVDDALDDELPRPQREGLPRTYRMRADQHYVDQLNAPFAGQSVRMIAMDDIEGEAVDQKGIRPLVESIRKVGIVHPLLVRRFGSRYAVIAGRRRFTAAHALRLAAVPCLVHEVDDAQAAALAAADALVVGVTGGLGQPVDLLARIRETAIAHVTRVRECIDLASEEQGWLARSVTDVIRAHGWRATCLLDILDLMSDTTVGAASDRPLPAIVSDVVEGFGAEATLRRLTIDTSISTGARAIGVPDRHISAALSGAVFAIIPLLERTRDAALAVHVESTGPDSLVIEVSQSVASVPKLLAHHFFDDDAAALMPGDWSAAIGARAVLAFAQKTGGHATMELPASGGCSLRIALSPLG